MRISAYARATNPKYANFFQWQALAGQLGTKAGKALSTPVGAAKLGAGLGAGVGAVNYLGSEDKSIGNLAGQVAGGAALGGAVGYGGASLKNAWQARKAGNQTLLPATTNASATNAFKQQAQLPAPATSGAIVPVTSQSGNSAPQNPVNTVATGAVEREGQKMRGVDSSGRGNASVPVQKPDGSVRGVLTPAQLKQQAKNREIFLNGRGVKSVSELNPQDKAFYLDLSRNTSPFANFKVRRYNGFIY